MASGTGRLRLFGEYGNPDFLKVLITLYTSEIDLSSVEILYCECLRLPFVNDDHFILFARKILSALGKLPVIRKAIYHNFNLVLQLY